MSSLTHHAKYCAAIKQARAESAFAFQSWFNMGLSESMHQIVARGYWDFTCHILTPTVCMHVERPEEKTALEIGYGGGRLMNAACSYFGHVMGVDIHDEHDAVQAFLHAQGKHNFKLIQTLGTTIDVPSASVDFVYSFIVLQHLPSFEVFRGYIAETYRCLKPGGVAQLYFGKFSRLHPLYQLTFLWQGYREAYHKPANHITLVVRMSKAKHLCTHHGFRVVQSGTSYTKAPDGYMQKPGGQHFVTLVRPLSRR